MPLCKDQPSAYDSSSFHLDELSAGKETLEEKVYIWIMFFTYLGIPVKLPPILFASSERR